MNCSLISDCMNIILYINYVHPISDNILKLFVYLCSHPKTNKNNEEQQIN